MVDNAPDPRLRNERAHRAILETALRLCRERGFSRTSMDAIAKEAGVGKQTLYRWWPSKAAVVIEAIDNAAAATTEFPDTGDIEADLRGQMKLLVKLLNTPLETMYRELIGAAQSDSATAALLVERLVEPRVRACRDRLVLAQQTGAVRDDIDPDDIVEVLYAPVYYRLLLRTRPIEPKQIDTMLDACFNGLRLTTGRRNRGRDGAPARGRRPVARAQRSEARTKA